MFEFLSGSEGFDFVVMLLVDQVRKSWNLPSIKWIARISRMTFEKQSLTTFGTTELSPASMCSRCINIQHLQFCIFIDVFANFDCVAWILSLHYKQTVYHFKIVVFLHHWGPSPETPNRNWHWSCRGFHGAKNADGDFRQVFRLCFCAAQGTCWCDHPLWECLYWKNASCWICGFVQIWTIDSARYHWCCQLVTPSSELQPQLQ